MGDFVRLLIEIVQFIWPFRIVSQWEEGGYYIFGKWWKKVTTGLYFVIPFFTDVHTLSKAEAIVGTGRLDITLSNGNTLSFSATANVRVADVYLALNEVENPHQTAAELIKSVLAEQLAEIDPDRLRPRRRGNLFKELQDVVAAEAARFGIEVKKIRFTSFVLNVRTYRLLMDQQAAELW